MKHDTTTTNLLCRVDGSLLVEFIDFGIQLLAMRPLIEKNLPLNAFHLKVECFRVEVDVSGIS